MSKPDPHSVLTESYREKIIRVPLVKITLPNPTGTSLTKYEPEYVVPIIVDLWRPRFAANPELKPRIGKVPPHLPQYRDIESVEGERGRLQSTYGNVKGSDTARVDVFLPGEKLWEKIRDVGAEIGEREVGAHHSFYDESTFDKIPKTATMYDVLDVLEADVVFEDLENSEDDREVETPESVAQREEAVKASAAKLVRMQRREEILAKKAEIDRKQAEALAKAEADADAEQAGDVEPATERAGAEDGEPSFSLGDEK